MTRTATLERAKAHERQRAIEEAKREKAKAEAAAVYIGVSESVKLAEDRGEVILHPVQRRGERPKPYRKMSGLDWLWHKGRLTQQQMNAGLKYGDDYRTVNDVRVKSCLGDVRGGHYETIQEAVHDARKRLNNARSDGLNSHSKLVLICDMICGEGERITTIVDGDDAEAKKLEAVLLVGLDLLAAHYGMVI